MDPSTVPWIGGAIGGRVRGGLMVGTALVWWGRRRDPHRHHGLPPQAPGEEAEGGRDRGAGE